MMPLRVVRPGPQLDAVAAEQAVRDSLVIPLGTG